MEIKPLTGVLGAEIFGADVKKPADISTIKRAFSQYSVIVLRNQTCSPTEQLAFAREFGTINVNRFFRPLAGHPEIATVVKEKDHKDAIGETWHTDHSYDQIPAMGSILRALEVPPFGGDTAFASMAQAYAAFSPTIQNFLKGLWAIHSSRHSFGDSQSESEARKSGRLGNAKAATQDARHPVVIKQPLSGRPGIYVNPEFTTHIEGMTAAESRAVLNMIYDHCQRPEFQCRVRWQAGDITMWDNRATWHAAINDYDGYRREMHRVTIEGIALEAA